ncbi:STAS/SEC14 domain-containing protein [Pseudoalteromonas luteoviolacea]|uniref:STAS/SEC14 domain-containing protein n=1 Tax=Pseudoalteromonas luteoviolacea TaxID=43657 RepID=UPI00114D7057|nr:STAS/SEC14 domain-containing protein [Pseudoalteromonas luteoviolacea]TQF67937.1 STAS/SEC14 domain-containing protein [Pseudoalteromonas luteoviolacea]
MNEYHGISVATEVNESGLLISFKAVGSLTHKDYLVILPVVDQALARNHRNTVSALIDITELTGWEMGEALHDIRIAFQYSEQFTKTAVIGSSRLQHISSILGGWILGGRTRFFSDGNTAKNWLDSP